MLAINIDFNESEKSMSKKVFKLNPYAIGLWMIAGLLVISLICHFTGETEINDVVTRVIAVIIVILIPMYLIRLAKTAVHRVLSRKVAYKPKIAPKIKSSKLRRETLRASYMETEEKTASWLTIFFWLILLFPIGIFYLLKKLTVEKVKYYAHGVRLLVMGFFIVAVSAIFIFWRVSMVYPDWWQMLQNGAFPFIYFLIGIGCIVTGIILRKKGATYEKYMVLIEEYHITNLDKLKSELHITYAKVTSQLEKLIEIGFLSECYIYHRDRELIVPSLSKKIAVRCITCGATTVLYSNEEPICAYCGGGLC